MLAREIATAISFVPYNYRPAAMPAENFIQPGINWLFNGR
jgi:hypothetical protein